MIPGGSRWCRAAEWLPKFAAIYLTWWHLPSKRLVFLIPDDPRWSQVIPDDPRWSQMIPDKMISDDHRCSQMNTYLGCGRNNFQKSCVWFQKQGLQSSCKWDLQPVRDADPMLQAVESHRLPVIFVVVVVTFALDDLRWSQTQMIPDVPYPPYLGSFAWVICIFGYIFF